MTRIIRYCISAAVLLAAVFSCRKPDIILPPDIIDVNPWEQVSGDIKGFFLLNEGNMGSNKTSLDYYDYSTGQYMRNIYGERNPDEVKDLGDVGNDLKIYGGKLWAVINSSNYVEVMDVRTARHITKLTIANCRYLAFKDGYAYVSSYAGPIKIDQNARIGIVVKIDTASLSIVDTCEVGYQPEEMAVVGDRLYVANSGGYKVPDYDRTVSVIDLNTFTEIKKIDVDVNLHRVTPDRYGNLYISSRGDYYDKESDTYIIDTSTDQVVGSLGYPCSNMALHGDSLYIYSNAFSYTDNGWDIAYAIVDTRTKSIISQNFITDGSDAEIRVPYGLAIHPVTGDIYITDAKDYVSPGTLHCYTRDGKKKWSVTTGDIPSDIVFTTVTLD